jgi:penicillin-binding protein 2
MDKTAPINITRRQFLRLMALAMAGVTGIAGCSLLPSPPTPTPVPSPTPLLSAEEMARNFLKAWSAADYNAMYAMLAPGRQETISASDFITRYRNVSAEATIAAIKTNVLSTSDDARQAEVKFTATYETNLVGTIQQDNVMSLRLENNRWGVLWSPNLIFPQLNSGYSVRFMPLASSRADIFDRKGRPLTAPQPVVSVDVVPSQMKNENAALATLARLLGKSSSEIKATYSKYQDDWRTSVGTITPEVLKNNLKDLDQPGILTDTTKEMRTYPRGQIAAHAIGYVGQASPEELAQLQSKGYRDGDIVGKAGLEAWGEPYLAGTRGGKLVITAPGNTSVATLANVPAKQSQNVYSTIDIDVQNIAEKELQAALEKDKLKAGAALVMDVSNGNILAMVSYPDYDPNRLTQKLTPQEFRAIANDADVPLFNRAAQAAHPPGSVFKIVSYAAAIDTPNSGLTPTTKFNCPGFWVGLGRRWPCWLERGHGNISFSDALTQSCDVTFYQVGQKLDALDRNLMTTYARGFGLGSKTGFELLESGGNIPDPSKMDLWRAGDPINMVIGQGYVLTSPLQIVNMMAAIANGGTLHKPHIVARISSIADRTEKITQPEVRGKLSVSAATLASLREALRKVTTEGTADFVFKGSKISVAGKTGTAQVGEKDDKPHTWFAAYAPADSPKIAVVVFVEHGREGSTHLRPSCARLSRIFCAGEQITLPLPLGYSPRVIYSSPNSNACLR